MKNYWGDPDEEPLPDWMNTPIARRSGRRSTQETTNPYTIEATNK